MRFLLFMIIYGIGMYLLMLFGTSIKMSDNTGIFMMVIYLIIGIVVYSRFVKD